MISKLELHKHGKRRMTALGAIREPYESLWTDCYSYCAPFLGKFYGTTANTNRRKPAANSKLLDARGAWASDVLGNGMASGLTSASMPWFKLTTADPDLKDFWEVKAWLATVEDRMYDFFAKTNFYSAQKSTYKEIGVIGTSANVMVQDFAKHAINFALTGGEYWLGSDDGGDIDTLYRAYELSSIALAKKYGIENCSDKVKEDVRDDRWDAMNTIHHGIEPNYDRTTGQLDNRNMPYRSFCWEATADEGHMLSFSGFRRRPFWAPRWDVTGMATYGDGRGAMALAELRALQHNRSRSAMAKDYINRPPLRGPITLGSVHANLNPGGVTAMPMSEKDNFGPIWSVPWQIVNVHREERQEMRAETDRFFYADLMFAITNMQGVQPRNLEEIAKRNEEALGQLGPAVERNNNEQLRVAIDRAFDILSDTGQLPPAPEAMQGQELTVEFTAILHQMQRAIGLGSIERSLGFVGNLAGIQPQVLDKIDFDQAVDEYTDRVGAPPKIVRSDEAVAKIREDRAQQEQQAKIAASAQPAADAAKAAELLSRTDLGDGTSVLARATGNG